MRNLPAAAAGLVLCLTLTACPGSYMQVRPQIGSAGLGPAGLTFTSRSISVARGTGVPMGDPSRVRPAPFYAASYTLWSGEEIIWKIARSPDPTPGRACNWDDSPSDIAYGVAPPCYREVVPARPLEPGRPYRWEGERWDRTDFAYTDPIELLSARGYAVRVRKWRDAHRGN